MSVKFSIIVPVYNVQDYLQRCVDSLLRQSNQDCEVILVDDGSTDSSGDICDRFCGKYANFKVVHKENGGLASARNAGLEVAMGDYTVFVDSDDWVEPDMLSTLADHIEDKPVDILTFGYRKRMGDAVLTEGHAEFPERRYDQAEIRGMILADSIAREVAFDQVKLPTQLSACMCTYRRAFLEHFSLRFESEREILNEDWMFNIRCYAVAQSVEVLYNRFYNYDTRAGSLSQSYKNDVFSRKKTLYARYREVLTESGNINPIIEKRLQNFWLTAVYECVVIEFYSPDWSKNGKARMKEVCKDAEFRKVLNRLNRGNSTPKGLLFKLVVKTGAFGLLRFLYLHKDIHRR